MKTTKEQKELEKEWQELELLTKRVELAKSLLELYDKNDKLLFDPEWIKKNIIRL